MKINTNDVISFDGKILRVLKVENEKCFVIDCKKHTMPYWVGMDELNGFAPHQFSSECRELNPEEKKIARNRYTMIADILPVLTNAKMRNKAIQKVAEEFEVSKQTVRKYLCLYLIYQDIAILAPVTERKRELTRDEKNMRWALNKFFYTTHKNTLKTAYTLMLKNKYCDAEGKLFESYPTFYQFRYFYRNNKDIRNYYISREGIKSYQRNHRPLLGDGVQNFAGGVGTYMLDSTICDIYLVNEAGNIVGRPILTAAVDAYSGLCVGYYLSWEGGVYSLQNLMLNIVSDKVEHCKKYGINIKEEDWPCSQMGGRLMTDMGKEYTSEVFAQIAELGVKVTNIQPYRPDLKSVVERFFESVQNLFKPYLKRKGVIEPDFQERGARDYRLDACLTLDDFTKIVLRVIIYYNTQKMHENFHYTNEMMDSGVKPYANGIWTWGVKQSGANLLCLTEEEVVMTLLPRTTGNFGKNGLLVNKMRYVHPNYIQQYLARTKNVTVAYNPDDVTYVWLIEENGEFVKFELIESRYRNLSLIEVQSDKKKQNEYLGAYQRENLQSEIDLANHIQVIANNASCKAASSMGIRETRKKEQVNEHNDIVRKAGLK